MNHVENFHRSCLFLQSFCNCSCLVPPSMMFETCGGNRGKQPETLEAFSFSATTRIGDRVDQNRRPMHLQGQTKQHQLWLS